MAIVKWTPFTELDSLERRMRRRFEEFGLASALAPAAEVYEEKELSIEVSDHTLAIRGEREQVKGEKTKEFALHERREREFERRFVLPAAADTEHVKATFVKGVLEVHAPKLQKPEHRLERGAGHDAHSRSHKRKEPTPMSPDTQRKQTKPGDLVVVAGHHVGEHERIGEILELLGDPVHRRYRVRWDDGHESIFYPSSDAVIRHKTRPRKEKR